MQTVCSETYRLIVQRLVICLGGLLPFQLMTALGKVFWIVKVGRANVVPVFRYNYFSVMLDILFAINAIFICYFAA